jgi:hypothetical protein
MGTLTASSAPVHSRHHNPEDICEPSQTSADANQGTTDIHGAALLAVLAPGNQKLLKLPILICFSRIFWTVLLLQATLANRAPLAHSLTNGL